MSSADHVALVALVVSLIALIIAMGQLCQQICGTAEGYRRCQESVVGPWSKLRRRKFLMSEFRFEMLYMTPNFILTEGSDVPRVETPSSRDIPCIEPTNKTSKTQKFWDCCIPPAISTLKKLQNHLTEPVIKEFEELETWGITGDDWSYEKTMVSKPLPAKDPDPAKASRKTATTLAGWVGLLNSLHETEKEYAELKSLPISHPPRPGETEIASTSFAVNTKTKRLRPSIQPWPRSWDLMPPEIGRPLATSTLGDILILAHRLRVVWRALEPGKRIMQGESPQGDSFSVLDLRGVSFVLQFTFGDFLVSKTTENRYSNVKRYPYVPSREADKMAFGIIPGCGYLGIEDFPLGGGEGDYDLINDMHRKVGVKGNTCEKLTQHDLTYHRYEALRGFSDLQSLLPPFIPIPGLSAVRVVPPHIDDNSVLMHKPGVRVILARMKKYLQQSTTKSPDLDDMNECFDKFRAECPVEFNNPGFFFWFFCMNAGEAFAKRMLEHLRLIHARTTQYFLNLQNRYQLKGKDPEMVIISPQKTHTAKEAETSYLYRYLVAAHIDMAVCAVEKDKTLLHTDRRPGEDAVSKDVHMFYCKWMSETAHLYADYYEEKVVDVMAHTYKGVLDNDQAKQDLRTAWWMLMLRGIAWNMSLYRVLPPGYPLPSQYYNSKFPVYIA